MSTCHSVAVLRSHLILIGVVFGAVASVAFADAQGLDLTGTGAATGMSRAPDGRAELPMSNWSAHSSVGASYETSGPVHQASDSTDDELLSRSKTILYSALLPGLGQYKWGHQGAATGFMLVEVASWTSLIVFQVQGDNRKDRYIQYAERFAGVASASGQSNQYYRSLARYDRSDPGPGSYNEIEVRLVAKRELHPNDPEAQQRYIEENSISGAQAWNWESAERRDQYGDIRSSSESSYQNAKFAVAGLIGGRILSVMHAVWMTGHGDDDEEEGAESAGLMSGLTPYVTTDLARGENRLGFRSHF